LAINPSIKELLDKLKKKFFDVTKDLNEISIFLCGGSGKEEKFRRKIGNGISNIVSNYKYSVYYPEDMFIELILGHKKQDLLTLENLLANSVNAVTILLQSPGTFTELGAFTNYKKLKDKLIVVIDPKYMKKRSFINLGPIRFLKSKTKSKILPIPLNDKNYDRLVKNIATYARAVAKTSLPIKDFSNPIFTYRFYLSLIYVFEPLPKDAIFTISKILTDNGNEIIDTAVEVVINSLINERKIFLNYGNLLITPKGINDLIYNNETKKRSLMVSTFLTKLRLEALNLTLRKDYGKVWGETKRT